MGGGVGVRELCKSVPDSGRGEVSDIAELGEHLPDPSTCCDAPFLEQVTGL
jgi:hypothetical protein